MFGPTADPGHKAMRFVYILTGNVPRDVKANDPRRPGKDPMTTVTAVKIGTLRLRPSHPAGNMNHPVWRRCLAIILDRAWTPPLPIYTYLIQHDEGRLILLDSGERSERPVLQQDQADLTHDCSRAASPGSVLPWTNSKLAPPPVET
jgi:hypothetical protein